MEKYDKSVSGDKAMMNVSVVDNESETNQKNLPTTDATTMKKEQIMNTTTTIISDDMTTPLSLVISEADSTNNNNNNNNNNTIKQQTVDQISHCVVSIVSSDTGDQDNLITSADTNIIKTPSTNTVRKNAPDDNILSTNDNDFNCVTELTHIASAENNNSATHIDTLPPNSVENMRAEATYRFRVEKFSKLKEQMLSPPFYVRNLPWRIMVLRKAAVPPTNEHHNHKDQLSEHRSFGFFLQCNGQSDSTTWSCNAIAELRLLSFRPDVGPFTRQIKHLFYNKENDWGFPHFMPWIDLLDPNMERIRNDTILLEVRLTADAPHGVFWDSKKHTGHVGLKNQGATCYMNSLLQTLFFTNYLRRAIYRMPTESDYTGKSVGLALQRVFHDLQFSDKPVGTKKLTKSFGWETLDSFMQHDVQEFLRVLLDKIETKMNKTCVEGTIPKLFEGKMSSYIKCKNVECASTRLETFYDIQLNIKGKKNIEESFQNYVATEILDGDNLYDAGEHGLQEAEKGVVFVKFPPVLHLHLMRFQYDPVTDNSVKFNDRFEFYEHIDLDRYLQRLEDVPAKYTLHAVLVHNGDNYGGHYVVYINPLGDGNWCKFDDDVVSRCSKTEAIDDNFGGGSGDNARPAGNAYMLVYIRDTDMASTLVDIPECDIPLELVERLLEERRIEQTRRRERTEGSQFMTVNVLIEEQFEYIDSRDIFDLEKAKYRGFKIKRTQPISELIQLLESTFLVPAGRMRLWQLIPRANTILRPILFDYKEHWTKSISHCADLQNPWTIFLELMSPDSELKDFPMFDRDRDILLLFKFYNPFDKRLNYCSMKTYTLKTTKVSDLVRYLNERLQLPLDNNLTLYEEQSKNVIHKINDQTMTLDKVLKIMREIMDSDVIIFERNDWIDHTQELPTCIDYFRELMFRIQVMFCDKNKPGDKGFQMELSTRLTYDQITMIIGTRIDTLPNEIQLYKCENYKDVPGIAIRASYEGTLKDILSTNKSKGVKKLFYQKLSMKVTEFQLKRHFKCVYLTPNMKEEKELLLYVNKNGIVKDLLNEAANELQCSNIHKRPLPVLRLVEVQCYKAWMGPGEHVRLETLSSLCDVTPTASGGIAGGGLVNQKVYRIEAVPPDEMELGVREELLPVVHFYKDIYNAFGVPFFVKAKDGEPYIVIKDRIQKRLNLSTKEFERYKFAVVIRGDAKFIVDDTVKFFLTDFKRKDCIGLPCSYFGLEHLDRTQRRSRYNNVEKAIKIYN